jgi:hypothetical protein
MPSKIPSGQANSLNSQFDKYGWVTPASTGEKAILSSLPTPIDLSTEIVILSAKVGSLGLVEISSAGKLSDGRLVITDKRIIVVSEAKGGAAEVEYDQITACVSGDVTWGSPNTLRCRIERKVGGLTQPLNLKFAFAGVSEWYKFLAGLFPPLRASVDVHRDATIERAKALFALFKAIRNQSYDKLV